MLGIMNNSDEKVTKSQFSFKSIKQDIGTENLLVDNNSTIYDAVQFHTTSTVSNGVQ